MIRSIGHSAAVMALYAAYFGSHAAINQGEPRPEPTPKPDTRTERQRWNDEVEQRKADKRAAKGKA